MTVRAWLWVAVVVGACGLGAACDHVPSFGNVELVATTDGGVLLSRLAYTVKGPGIPQMKGNFALGQSSFRFETFISHVPVGTGYEIAIDGSSADGMVTCEAGGKANVRRNETTFVSIPLRCKKAGEGQVAIMLTVFCPDFRVTSFSVSPLVVSSGGNITASATTTTPTDGGTVDFAWTAPVGTFSAPTALQTTYRCNSSGEIPLTGTATWGPCADSQTVVVTCLLPDGGAPPPAADAASYDAPTDGER